MLRPIPYSKPVKQRLFLDNPPNKPHGLTSSINVIPIPTTSTHKQNALQLKTEITEIKPSRQITRSQSKNYTLDASKSRSKFSRSKSGVRTRSENFRITEKNESIYKIFNSFMKVLAQNNIFRQMPDQNLQIRSETLKNICYYIANCFVAKNGENFSYLASVNKQKNLEQFIKNNQNTQSESTHSRKLKLFSGRVWLMLKQEEVQVDTNSLRHEQRELKKSVEHLLQHKSQLQSEIKSSMLQLEQLKRHFSEVRGKIENFVSQSEKIEAKVKEGRDFLNKVEEITTSIQQFAHSSSNELVKETAENYKNLENEMFKLTELVSHCANGKKDFQKSITLWDIEKRMETELKMFNKFLIQNTHSTYEEKCKELKDFLAKIKNQYSKIYEQLVNVIQQKTKYIKRFVDYVELWEQSYLEKSQYLSNLRTNFGYHCMKIDELRENFVNDHQQQENQSVCNQIILQVQDIIQLFKLGNFFY